MYYILTEQGSQIVESQYRCPTRDELAEMAQYFKCDLYVIEGEHTGLTGTYTPPVEAGSANPLDEAQSFHVTLPLEL